MSEYINDASINTVEARFDQTLSIANEMLSYCVTFLNQLKDTVLYPNIPTIDTVTIGDVSLPTTDILSEAMSRRPTSPTDDQVTITVPSAPVMGEIRAFPNMVFPLSSLDNARQKFVDVIYGYLTTGSTGLPADVEQAIWDRARARKLTKNTQLYDDVERYYSARGFSMPPGALNARLQEVNFEISRSDDDLNNDIMIEQARLAQANNQFILEKGALVCNQIEITYINMIATMNKNTIEVYLGEIEAYKTMMTAEIERVKAIVSVYLGRIEAYKTDIQAAGMEIEAQLNVIRAKVDIFKAEAELAIKEADVAIERARLVHAIQTEAIEAGAQVSAQISASALSAVSAHASIGYSGNVSDAYSHSWSESTVTENSYRQAIEEIHSYNVNTSA